MKNLMRSKWVTRPALFVVAAGLLGCGSLNEGRPSPFLKAALSLTGVSSEVEDTGGEDLSQAKPGDILLATLQARGATAAMKKVQSDGSVVTWKSPGNALIVMDQGILVSTRGLGDDLMGADITGLKAAFKHKGGQVRRQHAFLGSNDEIQQDDIICEVSFHGTALVQTVAGDRSGMHYKEDCKGQMMVFTNQYWLDKGQVIRSLQVISPTAGFMQSDQF